MDIQNIIIFSVFGTAEQRITFKKNWSYKDASEEEQVRIINEALV